MGLFLNFLQRALISLVSDSFVCWWEQAVWRSFLGYLNVICTNSITTRISVHQMARVSENIKIVEFYRTSQHKKIDVHGWWCGGDTSNIPRKCFHVFNPDIFSSHFRECSQVLDKVKKLKQIRRSIRCWYARLVYMCWYAASESSREDNRSSVVVEIIIVQRRQKSQPKHTCFVK